MQSPRPNAPRRLTLHKTVLRPLSLVDAEAVRGGYDPDDPRYSSLLSGCCRTRLA